MMAVQKIDGRGDVPLEFKDKVKIFPANPLNSNFSREESFINVSMHLDRKGSTSFGSNT